MYITHLSPDLIHLLVHGRQLAPHIREAILTLAYATANEEAPLNILDNTLKRTLFHALRHAPAHYYLELDGDGWANVEYVLLAFRYARLSIPSMKTLTGPPGDFPFLSGPAPELA